jgi:hypothetical protein
VTDSDSDERPAVTLDVCLRSSVQGVVGARQQAVLDRATQLKRRGRIQGVTVQRWGKYVTPPEESEDAVDDTRPPVVDELFELTADSSLSLSPYFRRGAPQHPDGNPVLYLPLVCLVVRVDSSIRGVYPASKNGQDMTIEDGLAVLEDGEPATNL